MAQVVHRALPLPYRIDSHSPADARPRVAAPILSARTPAGTPARTERTRWDLVARRDADRIMLARPRTRSSAGRLTASQHEADRPSHGVNDTAECAITAGPGCRRPSGGGRAEHVPRGAPAVATSRPARPHVAMALYGDLTYDSRVRKEARSLAEAGYDVTIVCLASGETRTDLPTNVTILVRLPTGALVIPGSSNPFSPAVRVASRNFAGVSPGSLHMPRASGAGGGSRWRRPVTSTRGTPMT